MPEVAILFGQVAVEYHLVDLVNSINQRRLTCVAINPFKLRVAGVTAGTIDLDPHIDRLVQEIGDMALQERGVQVLTASGDDLTETDDPSKVMMRQVAAAFAQFEKQDLFLNWPPRGNGSGKNQADARAGSR